MKITNKLLQELKKSDIFIFKHGNANIDKFIGININNKKNIKDIKNLLYICSNYMIIPDWFIKKFNISPVQMKVVSHLFFSLDNDNNIADIYLNLNRPYRSTRMFLNIAKLLTPNIFKLNDKLILSGELKKNKVIYDKFHEDIMNIFINMIKYLSINDFISLEYKIDDGGVDFIPTKDGLNQQLRIKKIKRLTI